MVVVTWPKDVNRYRRVIPHLPRFQQIRRGVRATAIVSSPLFGLALLIGVAVNAVAGMVIGLCVSLPNVFFIGLERLLRRSLARTVGAGTLTWRIGAAGMRVEGALATDIPWSEVAGWRRAAGHLIVEVRGPASSISGPGYAAPLEAFDAGAWAATESLLVGNVGARGAPAAVDRLVVRISPSGRRPLVAAQTQEAPDWVKRGKGGCPLLRDR